MDSTADNLTVIKKALREIYISIFFFMKKNQSFKNKGRFFFFHISQQYTSTANKNILTEINGTLI